MFQLSDLRIRNFSDLMCLPQIKRRKGNWKQWRKGKARSQIPAYTAFNMAVGWKPITLWVRRGWANFKVKTYGLKKTFLLYIVINAKKASYETRAIKAPQSKPRTRKNKKKKWSNQRISSKQRNWNTQSKTVIHHMSNIQARKRDYVTQLLFLSFPYKLVLSILHKIILPWTEEMFSRRTLCLW